MLYTVARFWLVQMTNENFRFYIKRRTAGYKMLTRATAIHEERAGYDVIAETLTQTTNTSVNMD